MQLVEEEHEKHVVELNNNEDTSRLTPNGVEDDYNGKSQPKPG